MISSVTLLQLLGLLPLANGFLSPVPSEFDKGPGKWAYMNYGNPNMAVLPGQFNRSVFDDLAATVSSDPTVTASNDQLNTTDFIAFDERFFDILGPEAQIRKVQDLEFQTHEATCWNPSTKELFFTKWGPHGDDDGQHTWQFIMNTDTNELRKLTTTPPLHNAHGCVFFNGDFYVVTDGSLNETASLNKIDGKTYEKTVLLNNYYEQPFNGFNDMDMDPEGNFYLADDWFGWGKGVTKFHPASRPTAYFVNATTMRPRPFHVVPEGGQVNGVAYTRKSDGSGSVYVGDTGASQVVGHAYHLEGYRTLREFPIDKPTEQNGGSVTFSSGFREVSPAAVWYLYDGVRVTRNGWIFGAGGNGVAVMDPVTGETLGMIHVGGGDYHAVNMAFGEHEFWIVGEGGVWHVTGVKERLARDW